MAETIVNKKIVISAEDRATSVITRANEAFERLSNQLAQVSGKFNSEGASQSSYRQALNETRASVDQAQKKFNELNQQVSHLKSPKPMKVDADTRNANNNLHGLQETAHKTAEAGKSMTKSFVFGNLIANGISSAANSVKNFAVQGFQAAEAGEETAARWRNLGMTAGGVRQVGAAVQSLKENTALSGEAAGNLVTRMYGLTGSTRQAIALSKGVGSIADSMHMTTQQADMFAGGLTRIESAGKVTSQSLGRLEKQAPGLTSALQKASGMSKKSFDDLLSSGKMTSDQFNQILEKASQNYAKNAAGWEKTTAGATKNIRQTWADDWKAAMAPLTEASGGALSQLSKSLSALKPEFTELGKAVAQMAKSFAEWLTPQHAKDIGEIVTSLGRMAAVIAKGVWKTFGGLLELIAKPLELISGHAGKSGDGLTNVANALEAISKNKTAMTILEGIAALLTVQFAYGKLFTIAKGIGLVGSGLGAITHIKFSGHLFSDLFANLTKLKNFKFADAIIGQFTKIKAAFKNFSLGDFSTKFIGKGNSFSGLFKGLSAEAETSGTSVARVFFSRFSAYGASNIARIGTTLGGRLASGITLVMAGIDIFKGLHERGTARAKSMGSGFGTIIGGAIGGVLGGPVGIAIGSMLGGAIGKKLGPSVGKAGKTAASVLNDIFVKHDWSKAWSTLTKSFHDMTNGLAKWWDQVIGKRTSSTKSKEPSQREIKSLGGNRYSKTDIANIKQMNAAVKAYTNSLKELKAVVKKDDPTKQLRNMSKEFKTMNPNVRNSAKYWKELAKPIDTSAKSMKQMNKSLQIFKGKNNPMERLNKSVLELSKTLKKYQFGKEIAKQMQVADKSMSGKHSFVGRFSSMVKSIEKELRSFSHTFNSDWRNIWNHLDSYPSRALNRVRSIVDSRLDSIESREHSFTSKFISSWRSWIDNVVSAMRSGFDKLPGIAQRAMSGIVSRLNQGISAINAVISDFGGDKRLGSIHYARGTFVPHPGGKAVVNDGLEPNKTELIWQPSKGWGTAQGQYVVRDLEAGSMVMDAKHSEPLLAGRAMPHYAAGSLSDEQEDEIAEAFMDNPVKASRDLILKVTNWNSSTPIIPSFGKATAIGFSRGIANVLKDLLGIIKEPINGDWTPVIKSAFRVLHLHAQGWQIAKLLRQIQTESGGREVITNNWDSNAAAGHPSQGLLQFIPSTFYTWADPRYRDINKGFDQLVAAIRCLNAGGEGGWGNIGNGHGWASGGEITSQQFGWVGDNPEHHEFVINPYNANAVPLLNKAAETVAMHHPEMQEHTVNSYSTEMIALMQAAIQAIQNIDIHPVAHVEEFANATNKYNAKTIGMMKGAR